LNQKPQQVDKSIKGLEF